MKLQPWKLKRTQQCEKCPWRKETNPFDIPNGYSVEKHRALQKTIAESASLENLGKPLAVFACHEMHEAHCIGWLVHQLGPGNNIVLRIEMMSCTNAKAIRLRGEQHDTFEKTLPP